MLAALAIETGFTRNVGHTRTWLRFNLQDWKVADYLDVLRSMDTLPSASGPVRAQMEQALASAGFVPVCTNGHPAYVESPVISIYPAKGKAKIIAVPYNSEATEAEGVHVLVSEYRPWPVFRSLLADTFEETVQLMGGTLDTGLMVL